jgi:hypothetical protein
MTGFPKGGVDLKVAIAAISQCTKSQYAAQFIVWL